MIIARHPIAGEGAPRLRRRSLLARILRRLALRLRRRRRGGRLDARALAERGIAAFDLRIANKL
ncbi:hypothetical protein [Salinarimonas ramus]|uniref:Uncharacterized protein n=1 Tax=Salinarimonas ramus TaxID=690164 RepID=A0A917V4W9_9HYPH|nr:hypothetical protein [Salinarimonas ramus]GGK37873.1 hypothetical protein GCM10011322_26160 [Salinarimonas ramus]